MRDLDDHRVPAEAGGRATDLRHTTRYSELVTRYLAAAGRRADPLRRDPAPVRLRASTGLVLVGVDESPASRTAVDHAAIEAELHGWGLRIVHVRPAHGRGQLSHDDAARLLERLADRVHGCSPSVAVTCRVENGAAAPLLQRHGREAALVVLGHGNGTADTSAGLSVGDRVAAEHSGPVVVVRVPGWPPGPRYGDRPLVVGAGQPGLATPLGRFALAEARARGCELVVMHADDLSAPSSYVEAVDGVMVHHRTVVADPATALLDFSNRAAAVVLGRPVGRLGSVGRTVLRRANCPVFLVG